MAQSFSNAVEEIKMETTSVTQPGEGNRSKLYARTGPDMLTYLILNSNNMRSKFHYLYLTTEETSA